MSTEVTPSTLNMAIKPSPVVISTQYAYFVNFSVGDLVYVKIAAYFNKTKEICIKEIQVPETNSTQVIPLYKDTFNSLWGQDELITYTQLLTIFQQNEQVAEWQFAALNKPPLYIGGNVTIYPNTISCTSILVNPQVDTCKGNIRYIKESAENGEMVQVFIKQETPFFCKDSFNRIWNSDELLSYSDARQLATNYITSRLSALG